MLTVTGLRKNSLRVIIMVLKQQLYVTAQRILDMLIFFQWGNSVNIRTDSNNITMVAKIFMGSY